MISNQLNVSLMNPTTWDTGELADDENMKLPDVRRRRRIKQMKAPKGMESKEHLLAIWNFQILCLVMCSNSWREMITDHA